MFYFRSVNTELLDKFICFTPVPFKSDKFLPMIFSKKRRTYKDTDKVEVYCTKGVASRWTDYYNGVDEEEFNIMKKKLTSFSKIVCLPKHDELGAKSMELGELPKIGLDIIKKHYGESVLAHLGSTKELQGLFKKVALPPVSGTYTIFQIEPIAHSKERINAFICAIDSAGAYEIKSVIDSNDLGFGDYIDLEIAELKVYLDQKNNINDYQPLLSNMYKLDEKNFMADSLEEAIDLTAKNNCYFYKKYKEKI